MLFVECVDGFYDNNCMSSCGHCSDGRPCDKITGYCLSGCESKFQLPFCQGTHCNECIISLKDNNFRHNIAKTPVVLCV